MPRPLGPAAPALRLPLHPRTVLVGVDTARAVLGLDADVIRARVDAGRFRWVWDIGLPGPGRTRGAAQRSRGRLVREFRFWARELAAPDLCHRLPRQRALDTLLGPGRRRWRAVEVAQLLLCSRPAVARLVRAGELAGPLCRHTRWITRPSLAAFLQRRLLR